MYEHPGTPPDTVTVVWCTTERDERATARSMLLRTAADLLAVRASEIWLGHESGGRPYVGGAAGGLRVSVSHGRGAAAVAVSACTPVGVDIEAVRRLPGRALARSWFAGSEAEWLGTLPEGERATAFLWLWTQKESVGKALGRGLRGGGMRRPVPLPGRWPPAAGGIAPRPVPGSAGLASGAALLDGGRFVVGVATAPDPGPPGGPEGPCGPGGSAGGGNGAGSHGGWTPLVDGGRGPAGSGGGPRVVVRRVAAPAPG
ncbi:4'-phosphopantetheinyl transferase superfamily protein [Streptomyces sp. AJS327]|uniref:4'-phosphopantetheinyl transferase family protein n=1 Tax=Streptomyces sp. AJS327 TaxID=2545265 RepID=UPI0015DDDCC5|nr:4'-phosphopantetheinyl transferase superfamily protein [Streptomyces sp. AJS327]MBA0052646.1 4'-phosphopantetheinyl transferase superfamily protein [Streptomyces sp. AJS327]